MGACLPVCSPKSLLPSTTAAGTDLSRLADGRNVMTYDPCRSFCQTAPLSGSLPL